jgi:hypothetical protein
MPTLLGREIAAAQADGSAQASGDRTGLVGTYELVTTEVKDAATGKWSPTPNFNSNGYIVYTETGHMGVHIMPKVRRGLRPIRRPETRRRPHFEGTPRTSGHSA